MQPEVPPETQELEVKGCIHVFGVYACGRFLGSTHINITSSHVYYDP